MRALREGVTAPEDGVYYRSGDYARFSRRLGIDLIDIAVTCVLWFLTTLVVWIVIPSDEPPLWSAYVILAVVAFGYFVLLKRSPVRTLGYKVCGAQLVNLQGTRPGIPSLTLRLLFGVFGPLNLLLDLIWMSSDRHCQTLRDKYAHTYVVKTGARPKGRGRIVYTVYHIMGAAFVLPEVRPDEQNGAR